MICVAFRCNVVEFDVKRTFKTICFERPACRNVNYQCHYQTTITDNTRLLRWYCKWRALQQVVAIQFDFACFFVCIFFRLLCTFQTFKHETVNSAIKIHRRAHRNSTFGFIIRFKLLYSHTHIQTHTHRMMACNNLIIMMRINHNATPPLHYTAEHNGNLNICLTCIRSSEHHSIDIIAIEKK